MPLVALGVGAGALAIVGLVWLMTRESGDATGTTTRGGPARSGARASAERDVTVVSVPTSYSDASVGRLAAQLRASDMRSRVEAANALTALGPRARQAVPALLNAMARRNSEIEFDRAVAKAIKAIGPAAVPQLVAVLRSGATQARFHAASALVRLGPDAAGAVDALVETLECDADMSVRSNAAAALGAIGPTASSALPALRRAAGNPNQRYTGDPARDELRDRAGAAIRRIQGK